MKRILSFILATLMLGGTLTGCQETAASADSGDTTAVDDTSGDTALPETTVPAGPVLDPTARPVYARLNQLSPKYSDDLIRALAEMADFYGEDAVIWYASLWDPQSGGFYYSRSAQEYDAFLPDVESTSQAISFLSSTGMIDAYSKDFKAALPKEFRERVISFVQSLQSEKDGYFYHPQWGETIGDARRGRDITSAERILNNLGGKALYPTANERLRATSTAADNHLRSKEAFLAYLKAMNLTKDSHSNGHVLSAQRNQIKAAGLGDVLCDYLDSLQNPENGLWQKEVDYTSLSGLMKISEIYNALGREIRYADKAVESALQAIMREEVPSAIIYTYNPWTALAQVISNAKKYKSYDVDAMYKAVLENAPAMIRKTVEKMQAFRIEDGSFSYYPGQSAAHTQGTWVGLGLREGDVNATCLAYNCWGHITNALGIGSVSLYGKEQFEQWLSVIQEAKPVQKQHLKIDDTQTFDGVPIDTLPPLLSATVVDGAVGVRKDPTDSNNQVLRIRTNNGANDFARFTTKMGEGTIKRLVWEGDFYFYSASSGYNWQFRMESAYMLQLKILNGEIEIYDCATTANTKKINLIAKVPMKQWFRLKVEYVPGTADTVQILTYINDKLVYTSNNFYGSHVAGAKPAEGFQYIQFFGMRAADSLIYVDNLSFRTMVDDSGIESAQ